MLASWCASMRSLPIQRIGRQKNEVSTVPGRTMWESFSDF